jgi:hypothetical protein
MSDNNEHLAIAWAEADNLRQRINVLEGEVASLRKKLDEQRDAAMRIASALQAVHEHLRVSISNIDYSASAVGTLINNGKDK